MCEPLEPGLNKAGVPYGLLEATGAKEAVEQEVKLPNIWSSLRSSCPNPGVKVLKDT